MKETIINKTIYLNGIKVDYELHYKKVKNLTIRINIDGAVKVSANKSISQKQVEDFMLLNSAKILASLEKCRKRAEKPLIKYYTEEQLKHVTEEMCFKVYPYYKERGIAFPKIRFRKMISRWGVCMPAKETLTFNTYLMYAPYECVQYVVLHEFTHFLHANHSKMFYAELEKVCPFWRVYKKMLSDIPIRNIDKNN